MKYEREYDNIAVLFEKTVYCYRIPIHAQIAQLVEQRTENPRVAGSIPALGIYHGALAQSVEHLTFNQVVRGSNPRCFIFKRTEICNQVSVFLLRKFLYGIFNKVIST